MRRSLIAGGIVLVLIFTVIWAIARSGNDSPQQEASVAKPAALVDYSDTSTEVRYTVSGQINAREDHRTIQITVGKDSRTITLFEGYQGAVLKQSSFLNDQDAYQAFLSALHNEGFTKARESKKGVEPLGACPLGKRYWFDIIDGQETKQSLWTTSCSGGAGTFAGKRGTMSSLFELQIPGYDEFTEGISL